jgi:dTDP-4-dehydrorhamnose 3,5-epimerase-like enzyme
LAQLIHLKSFTDARGSLNVIQDQLPFAVKRVYYMYGVPPNTQRGGHKHKKSRQALICLSGSCTIYNHDGESETQFVLDHPAKILIVEPSDWHIMYDFSENATLLVLASTKYDVHDYIDTPYPNSSLPT